MSIEAWQWVTLADGLPPTLVTNKPEYLLKPNETPSATGISALREGYLSSGTIPSATDRVAKTYTISTDTYYWHYNRCWRVSGSSLIFGAPRYTATYYRQESGEIAFNDDANSFITFLPIGGIGLILFKTTGAYIIPNAADILGNFVRGDFMQECAITTSTYAVELDGVVYFCNVDGLFAVTIDGKVEEISYPIRGDITPAVLKADYKNKLIIVGSAKVYDTVAKRWLAYSGSTFYYESRRLRATEQTTPLTVSRVCFDLKWVSTTAAETMATLTMATKVDDSEWTEAQNIDVTYTTGSQVHVEASLQEYRTGRDFKLKLTAMPTDFWIKRIGVYVSGYSAESRDT